MSISAGSNSRSIRAHGDTLIIGGEGHPTGADRALTRSATSKLEAFAREHWDVEAVTHRWSAQDPVPYDHLPVIGPYLPAHRPAARRLRVHEVGADRRHGRRARPARPHPRPREPVGGDVRPQPGLPPRPAEARPDEHQGRPRHDRRSAEAGRGRATATEIPPGEARVVRDGLGKTGVYRDEAGGLHAVSLRCTHLGCLLRFNGAERSWDCPCHGSPVRRRRRACSRGRRAARSSARTRRPD